MQPKEVGERIKASLKSVADRNHDGRVSREDFDWIVGNAVREAEKKTVASPKLALIITAVVTSGVTSMLWAIFC